MSQLYFNPRSLWRERQSWYMGCTLIVDFNPRSLWRERPIEHYYTYTSSKFQSTLPVKGATVKLGMLFMIPIFQSTLPVKGATEGESAPPSFYDISIHAPCEGSDSIKRNKTIHQIKFQSTLPVKGATTYCYLFWYFRVYFNPRSLWRERPKSIPGWFDPGNFNPRSLWRERL